MGLGLLFGYQGLVSSAGGALVPVVAIAILVTARSKLVAIRHLAVITLCALIVMGPWMYRNYLLFGAPILNTNGAHNFYQGNNPKATGRFTGSDKSALGVDWHRIRREKGEYGIQAFLWDQSLAYIRDNPGEAGLLAIKKLGYFWLPPIHGSETDKEQYGRGEEIARLAWLGHYVAVVLLALVPLLLPKRCRREVFLL